MSTWFTAAIKRCKTLVPGSVKASNRDHGELTITADKNKLLDLMSAARDDSELRFEMCTSVSGVHYPDNEGSELHVVYELLSMTHNRRMRIEVAVPDEDPVLDSIVSIYPHADWHERETWDMFGILFGGHPNLTRILMPDDWDGHPGRKDYPLGGVPLKFKGAQTAPVEDRRVSR